MKILYLFLLTLLFSCTTSNGQLENVKPGMSKEEVIAAAGEPDKKQQAGAAEFWTYTQADRTVIFRRDSVYEVVISGSATLDSLGNHLKDAGEKIKDQIGVVEDSLRSKGQKVENRLSKDTTKW